MAVEGTARLSGARRTTARKSLGPERVGRAGPARAVHDLSRRRTGRAVRRTAHERRNRRRAAAGERSGRAGDDARRRLERADLRSRASAGWSSGHAAARSAARSVDVRADAAVTINGLVRWTIMHGAAGLEAWAGTPGTVGGAIFGNAHFGGRLIGDLITEVRIADPDGTTLRSSGIGDGIRLRSQPPAGHRGGAVVGDVSCRARRSRGAAADRTRSRWPIANVPSRSIRRAQDVCFRTRSPIATAYRTAFHGRPVRSSIAPASRARRSATPASRPPTATSSSTTVTASAADIRRLIERCRRVVRDRFGVELREEIVYLGEFDVDTAD